MRSLHALHLLLTVTFTVSLSEWHERTDSIPSPGTRTSIDDTNTQDGPSHLLIVRSANAEPTRIESLTLNTVGNVISSPFDPIRSLLDHRRIEEFVVVHWNTTSSPGHRVLISGDTSIFLAPVFNNRAEVIIQHYVHICILCREGNKFKCYLAACTCI